MSLKLKIKNQIKKKIKTQMLTKIKLRDHGWYLAINIIFLKHFYTVTKYKLNLF